MKKLFVRLLVTLVVLVALGVAGMVALQQFVSIDNIKLKIREAVKAETGRDITFSGAQFVFWPDLALQITDVTFSNAPWSKDKNMLELGKLDVEVALKPLFQRQVKVQRIVLHEPVIRLETSETGVPNWDFSKEKKIPEAKAAVESAGEGAEFSVLFDKVQIDNASLSFKDGQKKTAEDISHVDVSLRVPDLKGRLDAKGALDYKGKRVRFMLSVEKLADFLASKPVAGRFEISTDDMEAKMTGALSSRGTLVDGDIDAKIISLPHLASWAQGAEPKPLPFEKVSFRSGAKLTSGKLMLSKAELSLDDIKASGDMNIAFAGKPDIYARLSIGKINLDRFTGASGAEKTASVSGANENWDTKPVDFSGLNKVDLDAILLTEGFSLKGVDVGSSTLTATIKGGKLRFTSSDASLFEGKFGSDLTLDAATAQPSMAFTFKTSGVQAKPILTTFANFKKLSGMADAQVSVTSSGTSQKEIIGNLDGRGSVMFHNGSFEGIDLVNIAQLLQSKLTDMGVGEGKTDFVDLGGTFKITKGVAQNDDFKMRGPLVQATGSGAVNLPEKSVNYRVVPVLTASSAVEGASGVKVPVDIKGPFSNIKVKPDYAPVVQRALENPEEIKATVKNVKDQGKVILNDLKDIKKDPAKALESILGGGLLGGSPAPAPAPSE